MTSVVCDASVLVKLLLPEPDSKQASAVAETHHIVVPELALIEVANALWAHVHGQMISLDQALALFTAFTRFKLDVHQTSELLPRALTIAGTLDHPIYDCVYLALTEALNVPLVTADKRLARAVRHSNLPQATIKTLAEFG